MHDQDSQFLVAAAQDGDKPAVEALLDRHLPGLRAFVRAKSGPTIRAKESCSDLVQTVCLEVLHGIDTYEWRGEGSFRHWLFTLAIHKIHNRADHWGAARRDAKREVLASATHGALANAYASVFGPSAHAMANETMARLESSLDTLPEDSREVVVLSRESSG